ncbi:MAG TPA: hypothetical protein VLN58_15750 [Verrucomicrobiae bacterium]|nr:hypothetical protein [Verrucomicrobiae bacterium]
MKSRDRDHSAIGLKHLKIGLLESENVKKCASPEGPENILALEPLI